MIMIVLNTFWNKGYLLKHFLEQRLYLEEQQKWVTNMLGYDFEIIYKKGKQDVVADAL